jgi:hypothetical protein
VGSFCREAYDSKRLLWSLLFVSSIASASSYEHPLQQGRRQPLHRSRFSSQKLTNYLSAKGGGVIRRRTPQKLLRQPKKHRLPGFGSGVRQGGPLPRHVPLAPGETSRPALRRSVSVCRGVRGGGRGRSSPKSPPCPTLPRHSARGLPRRLF